MSLLYDNEPNLLDLGLVKYCFRARFKCKALEEFNLDLCSVLLQLCSFIL